jgi:NAD(P)-dependent dehydrogenase (short-subunit alcohol dehydrogenase family)
MKLKGKSALTACFLFLFLAALPLCAKEYDKKHKCKCRVTGFPEQTLTPPPAQRVVGRVPECDTNDNTCCRDLCGKTVLVVGGAKGMGAAVAKAYADQGCKVIATSRHGTECLPLEVIDPCHQDSCNPSDLGSCPCVEPDGYTLSTTPLDVTDQHSVDNFFATEIGRHGKIDILVLTAGLAYYGPMYATSGEDLTNVYNVNTAGYQRVVVAALPYFNCDPRVIGIGSIEGEVVVGFLSSAYNMSKRALQFWAENWNTEGCVLRGKGLLPTDFNYPFVTLIEPTQVNTHFGQCEYAYPKSLGPNASSVCCARAEDQGLPGMEPEHIADAIVRIGRFKNPNTIYFIDRDGEEIPGVGTWDDILNIVYSQPIDLTGQIACDFQKVALPCPCN